MEISDRDWREFRRLRELARRRFAELTVARCQRLCRELKADPLALEARLMSMLAQRQHEHAALFGDFRRSTASLRLHLMVQQQLLQAHELDQLSIELRRAVLADL